MDDLAAFVSARLDEDEAAASAVEDNSEPWPGQWEADGNYALRTHNGWVLATAGTPGGEFRPGVLAHIARNDPARTRRRVMATRAVLTAYEMSVRMLGEGLSRDKLMLLRAHAVIWEDHPDYRPEWRP